MSIEWRLGFIGAGVMAETMVAGVDLPGERILVSDPHPGRRQTLQENYGVGTTDSNLELVQQADLLVLAVKPQNLAQIFTELGGHIPADKQVLSIVAGASLDALRRGLQHASVARAMPNLPCRVHQGITVWTGADGNGAERIEYVLTGIGESLRVDTESHVDRATAVSGTGPAIVAEFVKSFMEAATYIGQPREMARQSVLATLMGTAEMIRRYDDVHVAQLIDEVTSPGGTTSRALQVLKQGGMSAVVTESVDAAYGRTLELGAALEEKLNGP